MRLMFGATPKWPLQELQFLTEFLARISFRLHIKHLYMIEFCENLHHLTRRPSGTHYLTGVIPFMILSSCDH